MTSGHDRRSFFRELLRGASRAASEVDAFRRAADDAVRRAAEPDDEIDYSPTQPVPAEPATHLATIAELRRLCVEIGRETWADEAASLARTSLRLTPGSGDECSWLGGTPRAASLAWPEWDGVELAFVGRIGLASLPPVGLPAEGALLVFFALDQVPAGLRPEEGGACRVVHVPDAPTDNEPLYSGMPFTGLLASSELTLPATPGSLTLDAWELDAWADLRERLSGLQGVELEDRAAEYHALHRLLGHPDAYGVGMELDAELVTHGVDLEEEPFAHALHEELAPGADEWVLLLQLSNDDAAGIDLGEGNRLYVWIRRDDLSAGRFDRTHAFVR